MLVLSVEEVQAHVDRITAAWKNTPTIHVVADASGLPVQTSGPVRGLWADGEVWINASELHNAQMVEETLLHETVGHGGLRQVLGTELNDVMDRVWDAHAASKEERDAE